jgi:hypothetical protein
MTSNTDMILEAFVGYAETDEDIGPHNLASALRECVATVVLPYMQYAEWEIVHKIIEDINEVADELDTF